jgi:CDP-3, 6-dideoxy-D-glycero-L-glycero-4-hexulose-4-reductase
MKKKGLLITGSTGFIGSNFYKKTLTNNKNIILVKRLENSNEFEFYDSKNFKISNLDKKYDSVSLLHLATHFSIDESKKREIYSANIEFGKNLIEKRINLTIEKIVYTNTMYSYSSDLKLRNSYYTSTKNEFSNLLSSYCSDLKIKYEEIFLDNTYGDGDRRKKILSLIIESILNEKENPIRNQNNFINLVNVSDVCERLSIALNENKSLKSAFISRETYNLQSIYKFLKNFHITNEANEDLLVIGRNQYLNTHPDIEHKKIKLTKLSKGLLELFRRQKNIL